MAALSVERLTVGKKNWRPLRALAAVVFADETARADLNAIIHPLVAARSRELMDAADPGSVVVYEIPLLAETGRSDGFEVVVVVEAPLDVRLARLAGRGLDEAQARARIAAQASDDQRRAIADEVVVNAGGCAELAAAAQALWERLVQRLDVARSGDANPPPP